MQRAVWMHSVVVGEPGRQLSENGWGIWRRIYANVIALESLHERLSHAVALRRATRCPAGLQANIPGKTVGLMRDVAGTVVREPLRRMRHLRNLTEASGQGLHHDVPYQLSADACSRGSKGDGLPIAAVQTERHTYSLAVIAADLKAVRAIPLI